MPLDSRVETLPEVPHTISYVIRKRQQIDGLMELPKDKRPTDDIIWEGTSEELDEWLDKVFDRKESTTVDLIISEVEE